MPKLFEILNQNEDIIYQSIDLLNRSEVLMNWYINL